MHNTTIEMFKSNFRLVKQVHQCRNFARKGEIRMTGIDKFRQLSQEKHKERDRDIDRKFDSVYF